MAVLIKALHAGRQADLGRPNYCRLIYALYSGHPNSRQTAPNNSSSSATVSYFT